MIYVKSLQDNILSPVIALLLMVGGVESDMEKEENATGHLIRFAFLQNHIKILILCNLNSVSEEFAGARVV